MRSVAHIQSGIFHWVLSTKAETVTDNLLFCLFKTYQRMNVRPDNYLIYCLVISMCWKEFCSIDQKFQCLVDIFHCTFQHWLANKVQIFRFLSTTDQLSYVHICLHKFTTHKRLMCGNNTNIKQKQGRKKKYDLHVQLVYIDEINFSPLNNIVYILNTRDFH